MVMTVSIPAVRQRRQRLEEARGERLEHVALAGCQNAEPHLEHRPARHRALVTIAVQAACLASGSGRAASTASARAHASGSGSRSRSAADLAASSRSERGQPDQHRASRGRRRHRPAHAAAPAARRSSPCGPARAGRHDRAGCPRCSARARQVSATVVQQRVALGAGAHRSAACTASAEERLARRCPRSRAPAPPWRSRTKSAAGSPPLEQQVPHRGQRDRPRRSTWADRRPSPPAQPASRRRGARRRT